MDRIWVCLGMCHVSLTLWASASASSLCHTWAFVQTCALYEELGPVRWRRLAKPLAWAEVRATFWVLRDSESQRRGPSTKGCSRAVKPSGVSWSPTGLLGQSLVLATSHVHRPGSLGAPPTHRPVASSTFSSAPCSHCGGEPSPWYTVEEDPCSQEAEDEVRGAQPISHGQRSSPDKYDSLPWI